MALALFDQVDLVAVRVEIECGAYAGDAAAYDRVEHRSVQLLEHVLVGAAVRTDPAIGQRRKGRAGLYPAVGITHRRVVHIAAHQTLPLLHRLSFLPCGQSSV